MKRMIFLIAGMMLLMPFVHGAVTFTHTCSDSRCTEGTPINYSVYIRNNIKDPIQVNYLKIRDVATSLNYATLDDVDVHLEPGADRNFTVSDRTPAPFAGGYTAPYHVCFGVTVFRNDTINAEICSDTVNSLTTLPLEKIECQQDRECAENQFCDESFFKCRDISCNGFTVNHQCVHYFTIPLLLVAIGAVGYLLRVTSKKA